MNLLSRNYAHSAQLLLVGFLVNLIFVVVSLMFSE
jgi:hypothetical protein